MDRKWSIFEIGVLVACALLGGGALLMLRLYAPSEKIAAPTITIWGTFPTQVMNDFIVTAAKEEPYLKNVRYTEVESDKYYSRLLEVFASNASQKPDLFLIDQAHFLEFENKVYDISQSLTPHELTSEYVEAAEVYLVGGAVRAVPFSLDPLVMYWNKDLFVNAGIPAPPLTWSSLIEMTPLLTKTINSADIDQSATALGAYDNVRNAKGVLSALFLQSGLRIVNNTLATGYSSDMDKLDSSGQRVGEAVLRYYTDFSNPTKLVYTWNLARSNDRTEFLSGSLALYFGYASEYEALKRENPNLNFSLAELPQRVGSSRIATYANVYGFVVPKQTPLVTAQAAVQVARLLTSKSAIASYLLVSKLPPIRRDLVSASQSTTFGTVTYKSALSAKSWLEPSQEVTDAAFGSMVRNVVSGRSTPQAAITDARNEIEFALQSLRR